MGRGYQRWLSQSLALRAGKEPETTISWRRGGDVWERVRSLAVAKYSLDGAPEFDYLNPNLLFPSVSGWENESCAKRVYKSSALTCRFDMSHNFIVSCAATTWFRHRWGRNPLREVHAAEEVPEPGRRGSPTVVLHASLCQTNGAALLRRPTAPRGARA